MQAHPELGFLVGIAVLRQVRGFSSSLAWMGAMQRVASVFSITTTSSLPTGASGRRCAGGGVGAEEGEEGRGSGVDLGEAEERVGGGKSEGEGGDAVREWVDKGGSVPPFLLLHGHVVELAGAGPGQGRGRLQVGSTWWWGWHGR